MTSIMQEVQERENDLFRAYRGAIPEACNELNSLQYEKIDAVVRHYGKAFTGKINFYGDERSNLTADKIFAECGNETVCNFSADFVIPTEDKELVNMIVEWNTSGLPKPAELIEEIVNRVTNWT